MWFLPYDFMSFQVISSPWFGPNSELLDSSSSVKHYWPHLQRSKWASNNSHNSIAQLTRLSTFVWLLLVNRFFVAIFVPSTKARKAAKLSGYLSNFGWPRCFPLQKLDPFLALDVSHRERLFRVYSLPKCWTRISFDVWFMSGLWFEIHNIWILTVNSSLRIWRA